MERKLWRLPGSLTQKNSVPGVKKRFLFENIVVLLDGSIYAAQALPAAKMLCRTTGAKLHLLSAVKNNTKALQEQFEEKRSGAESLPRKPVKNAEKRRVRYQLYGPTWFHCRRDCSLSSGYQYRSGHFVYQGKIRRKALGEGRRIPKAGPKHFQTHSDGTGRTCRTC